MVSVSTRGGSPVVVSNYRYNGLGFRIGWQYHQAGNAGGPGIVAADPWFWLVYNDKWQQIAKYRVPGSWGNSWANAAETQPKEVITHHMARVNCSGGSSDTDSVTVRERDNEAERPAVSFKKRTTASKRVESHQIAASRLTCHNSLHPHCHNRSLGISATHRAPPPLSTRVPRLAPCCSRLRLLYPLNTIAGSSRITFAILSRLARIQINVTATPVPTSVCQINRNANSLRPLK